MAYGENTEGRAYGLEEHIRITPDFDAGQMDRAKSVRNRKGGGIVHGLVLITDRRKLDGCCTLGLAGCITELIMDYGCGKMG